MSQIPPVQEEVTDAEPEKRRPVDVPLRVVRDAVQRPGTCESLELRICALTGQGNRVSVETTLQGVREGVFGCRPRQEGDREDGPGKAMVSKTLHSPTIA